MICRNCKLGKKFGKEFHYYWKNKKECSFKEMDKITELEKKLKDGNK